VGQYGGSVYRGVMLHKGIKYGCVVYRGFTWNGLHCDHYCFIYDPKEEVDAVGSIDFYCK